MSEKWNGRAAPVEQWRIRFRAVVFDVCRVVCQVKLGNSELYQIVRVGFQVNSLLYVKRDRSQIVIGLWMGLGDILKPVFEEIGRRKWEEGRQERDRRQVVMDQKKIFERMWDEAVDAFFLEGEVEAWAIGVNKRGGGDVFE